VAEVRIRAGQGGSGQALLHVGDVLAVEVAENRMTGYVWSVDAVPGMLAELPADPGVVPGAGTETDTDTDTDTGSAAGFPRPGAAGGRTFRFAAEQPGTGELGLRHSRPWEPAGGDEVTIPVHVEPAS